MEGRNTSISNYSVEEALDFVERVEGSLKVMNQMGFADMNIKPPEIDFFPDSEQYYDSQLKAIHIGINGIVELFRPIDEADFMSALNYVYGHEQQHCRSTADRPYRIAIQKACEAVVEYIQQKVEGYKRRFRNPSDYESFTEQLPSMGVFVSWDMVFQLMGQLANSLEDGRIERIRSNRFEGFSALRTIYRGRFWEYSDIEYRPFNELTIMNKLEILLADILSLATCQLHLKGFAFEYADTPLMDEVNAMMPHIAKAVLSGKTRGLQEPMTNIARALAPYIFEVCSMSAQDMAMRQALLDMIQKMIQSAIDSHQENGLSERNEDTDEGSLNTALPISDLVVEVDEETFEKLKEKTSNQQKSGGIRVKVKNKEKEDENNQNAGDSTNVDDSSPSSPSNSEQPEEQSSKDGSPSNGNANENSDSQTDSRQPSASSKKTSETNHSSETSQKNDGNKGESSQQFSSQSQPVSDNSPEVLEKTKEGETSNDGNSSEHVSPNSSLNSSQNGGESGEKEEDAKHVSKAQCDEAQKAVLEAMKQAAKEARQEATQNITSINASIPSASRQTGRKEVKDISKPISAKEMADICDFREVKREYQVKDKLPAVLAQRGKVFHRKNEKYFKALSVPDVSYLDSGNVDPSLIYSLGMGNTEIFRKQGRPYKPNHVAYMLVDNSGSMSGEKREEACKAAAVIEEGFKNLMPLKIVAFDYSRCVIHEVVKNWDEALNQNCCWNFAKHGRCGNGNADGYDIEIATKELMARPESQKLLLVLSDGTPSDTQYCKRAIAKARKQGIKVVGIYFETGECYSCPQFEDMYQKDYVCCPVYEIDTNLEKIFKKFSRS